MNSSKYSDDQKRAILREKEEESFTAEKICDKYKISIATYYIWKRKFSVELEGVDAKEVLETMNLKEENKTLRRLYINLSEHNYRLAKFLNNQL